MTIKKISIILLMSILTVSCITDELKVMSFNVRLSPNDDFDGENSWINRRSSVLKMINDLSPDVFGVQEAIYHQAKFMEDSLTQYVKYGVDREGGLEKGEAESNAIFFKRDRFDLLEKGTFWLSETPDIPSKGWDAACFRVVTWVRLKDKYSRGKELFFFNTHFDHKGEVARGESGKLLVRKVMEIICSSCVSSQVDVQKIQGNSKIQNDVNRDSCTNQCINNEDVSNPNINSKERRLLNRYNRTQEKLKKSVHVVITGDFNSEIHSTVMVPILDSYCYTREALIPVDTIGTFNNWGKNVKNPLIDHIFVKNLVVTEYRVETDGYGVPYISDHYPVISSLKYK